jgi:hypothetical protein
MRTERMYRRCKTTFFAEVPAQKKFGPGTITSIPPTPTVKKQFILGLIGGSWDLLRRCS